MPVSINQQKNKKRETGKCVSEIDLFAIFIEDYVVFFRGLA